MCYIDQGIREIVTIVWYDTRSFFAILKHLVNVGGTTYGTRQSALSISYTTAGDSAVKGAEAGEAKKQHHHVASGAPLRPLYGRSRPRSAAGLRQCLGAFPGRVEGALAPLALPDKNRACAGSAGVWLGPL